MPGGLLVNTDALAHTGTPQGGFDEISHAGLMDRVRQRITDKRVLMLVKAFLKGTHWMIEGDISDCFGGLDHTVTLSILAENIHDGPFLQLIDRMLKAGYLEDWRWNDTLSGAPQGGVASPVLSNIYLDRFDQFVEQQLLPDYSRGRRRHTYRAYEIVENRIGRARRHVEPGGGARAAARTPFPAEPYRRPPRRAWGQSC